MVLRTNEYLNHVLERIEPVGHVVVRAMFGGYGLYHRDVMFGLVAFDELYFKVGPANILEYKTAGSGPFIYPGKHKPVTMSYWRVPEEVLEEDAMLEQWMMAAYKVARENKESNEND